MTDLLYKGWMTGWAYEACHDLYFKKNSSELSLDNNWENLLEYVYAYGNVIDEWGKVGFAELAACLDKMRKHVSTSLDEMKKGDGSENDQRKKTSQFEGWFREVEGAARIQGPFVRDIMEFASLVSRLVYAEKETVSNIPNLKEPLGRIEGVIVSSADRVISHDIEVMKKYREKSEEQRRALAREWSELIIGRTPARQLLRWQGRAVLYMILGTVGAATFSGVGFGFAFAILWIAMRFGLNLSTLSLSNADTILGVLTTLGLTLPVLAKRAWEGMKTVENQLVISLARLGLLRKNSFFR